MTKTNQKTQKIRMPKGEAVADKNICDLTLAKLRTEANFNKEENHMYIDKARVRREKKGWAESMGKDLRTFNSRFKKLEDKGFLKVEGNYYILTNEFGAHNYFDIPKDTLTLLVDTCQDDVIKVYLYLLAWHISKAKTNETFTFSLNNLCAACGLSNNVKTRDKMFNILLLLEKLGLIVLSSEKVIVKQNKFNNELFELLEVKQELDNNNSNLMKAQKTKAKTTQPQALEDNGFKF